MRFMMLVIPKAYENAKADFVPSADLVAKMTTYNPCQVRRRQAQGHRRALH